MDKPIRILGRSWRLVSSPGMQAKYGCWGDADPPTTKGKAIRFDPSMDDIGLLSILLHEMLHAALPCISEEVVEQFAIDHAHAVTSIFKFERISHATEEASEGTAIHHAPRSGSGADATS